MIDLKKIADTADMIINGYAFTKYNGNIRILNLNNPAKAAVISRDGEVLETDMDDIELAIIKDYYRRNGKYMEE